MYDFISTLGQVMTMWEAWITIALAAIMLAALPKSQKHLDDIDSAYRWLGNKIRKAPKEE